MFACRTPHRPNPIGLTLAKLTGVSSNKLFVSGIDLIEQTPILDIKPYIPNYDNPITNQASLLTREASDKLTTDDNKLLASNSLKDSISEVSIDTTCASQCMAPTEGIRTADWLNDMPANPLQVQFTEKAQQQLSMFKCAADDVMSTANDVMNTDNWHVDTLPSVDTVRQAIVHILQEDPRSIYRKNKCNKDPYKMSIDNVNVTCFFEGHTVKVISIEPKHKTKK